MISTAKRETPLEPLYFWHTVLVVDDDPNILSSFRRALEREPYDTVTTDRPALALEWLGRKNVSLVISDQRMPEMEGADFLERVWRKSPATHRILLTGHPEAIGTIPESRRCLMSIVHKPWDEGSLKATIRRILSERERGPRGSAPA